MNRDLFASAVRERPPDLGLACALIAREADASVEPAEALSRLDAYAALARPVVERAEALDPGPRGQAEGLRAALGEQAGFHGLAEDYEDLRASLLPDVLSRRHGLPILLTVVWLEVARRLGLSAYPVALPGDVVAGVGEPAGAHVLVSPFHGGRLLSVHDVAERVRAVGAVFSRDLLAPTEPDVLLLRVLTNIRLLAARRQDLPARLWATRLSLTLPRHPAGLRRELGEILVRSGDFRGGAAELEAYAAAVEAGEPAAAQAARAGARMARARLN